MVDFLRIATRSTKKGVVEVYPKFIVGKSKDLMIRGGDFYAIWLEDRGLWSTDEQDVIDLVDRELLNFTKENKHRFDDTLVTKYMWDSESGIIDIWHKYCQKQMRDNFHTLNEKLIFSNQESTKSDYASKRLPYPLGEGDISSWDELISFLYSPEERHKIEWCIGAVVNGASKKLEKFAVFYGAPGTGKSTVLNIIQRLFEGYYATFDSKSLASANDSFALESFRANPLVAIQHDGDLSKIEDNTRINSLTSHEKMSVNEKHKSKYEMRFITFLFMGSNKVVKITDSKSGILRRLIDIVPTGEKMPRAKYNKLMADIYANELGAIAWHCMQVFEEDPLYYDDYKPTLMMSESNDFYNFVLDSYSVFSREDGTTLKAAWEMYKVYCEDAKISYPLPMRAFKAELANYFKTYEERVRIGEDWVRSYYSGFKKKIFLKENLEGEKTKPADAAEQVIKHDPKNPYVIEFKSQPSVFDEYCKDCPAQYASVNEFPRKKWDDVFTRLDDLNTKRLHYVKLNDINHIVVDFDLKGPDGEKNFERNLEEASKWPKTYAELSKSGKGIHLHYIYDGDPMLLDRVYAENIEIKVFVGNSALRRKLTKCNSESINHLADILPKRKEKIMVNFGSIQNEKALRTLLIKNLNKEIHPNTKPSIYFIYKNLEDAYNSGMKYDVSDMYGSVVAFAATSTHNADYCLKLVEKMHFKSDEPSEGVDVEEVPIIFLDVEVFPNLFYIGYKKEGPKAKHMHLFNPSPKEIEALFKYRIVGFNCRRYDNHMLYARMLGYGSEEIFKLSQKIIASKSKVNTGLFNEAYNLSYTDIYDYAEKKQSLKKWEIELGIHHAELGLPWDKPVAESQWNLVAEYCDNDVDATEVVWNHTQDDFQARKMLVKLANLLCPSIRSCVNDTTNQLTGRIIFRGNRSPQSQFLYTDLVTGNRSDGYVDPHHFPNYIYHLGKSISINQDKMNYKPALTAYRNALKEYSSQEPHPNGSFILRDGYLYFNDGPDLPKCPFDLDNWVQVGEIIGEGGYVWANPGMYANVTTLDVASMHPHSAMAMKIFGEIYTKSFQDIVDLRIAVKHEDWGAARAMFGGILEQIIDDAAEKGISKELAKALKIAINSVYGLTSAHFDNLFRDPRNVDNIVAKRGALFMHQLKYEVQKLGGEVVHIKTDSIKIAGLTEELKEFIINKGKEWGYDFEIESIYDKFCLVNDSVYVARKDLQDPEYFKEAQNAFDNDEPLPTRWTATGAQFQVPYVFKTCFSKEPIVFSDLCETKEVKTCIYLNMNENMPADALELKFVGRVGLFTPIKAGCGGGELVREAKKPDNSIGYDAVTGTKGYRWLESEEVLKKHLEDNVDKTYYNELVNEAINTISSYGDYEWFTESPAPFLYDDTLTVPQNNI